MDSDPLLEDINLKVYGKDDLYIPYVEMVPNPGEIFDLQKFGKTHGFIKAPTNIIQPTTDELYSYLTRYKMKQTDVEIYDAMSFVHAYLDNTTQRKPETVDLFLNKNNNFTTQDGEQVPYSTTSYSVKRGQSILFNSFRGWRQLNLLEMSALLNRITQSAVIRIIQVETSDIPKTQVRPYIQRLKEKIEQKTGLDISEGMTEYNNPSPIINTIYIPTHEGKGVINATTIGGDYDPKSLADIEYYRDRLFGSLKIPKQYFGFTEDGAGFNGGQSLTIISSRYGKSIKMIKKKLCELVTNILNYFLINRGLDSYVNRFSVKMQVPITQEELDRRTNNDNRIRYVSDVMNQLGEVDDKIVKLRIQRELLSTIINNSTVMKLLDGYIEKLETEKKESKPKKSTKDENVEDTNFGTEDNDNLDLASPEELEMEDMLNDDQPILLEKEDENDESSYLPSPEEIGIDFLNNK